MRRKQHSADLKTPATTNFDVDSLQIIPEEFEMCRLCAQQSKGSFEIFGQKGVKKEVATLAKIYLSLEILESDIVTKTICKKCSDQLTKFHHFAANVQTVQLKLFEQRLPSVSELPSHEERGQLEFQDMKVPSFLINKCSTELVHPCFEPNQVNFMRVQNIKPDDLLQELPLDLDFDETDGLHKLKNNIGDHCTDYEEREDLDQVILEDEQDTTTSEDDDEEEEEEELRETRKMRHKLGLKEQEKDLAEFYQMNCSDCGDEWPSFSALSSHSRKVHDDRPTVNCQCGKSFNRRSHLIRHRNQHLGVYRYKCETCGRGFHFKFMLRSHMFTHGPESDKPYKCDICQRAYITKSGLTNHRVMKHLPPRARVTCDICNSTFSHPNCLYTHKKTVHADQRSFVCHICGKTMSTLGNLKGHLETHKEACNVQCEVCGKRFKTRMRLVRHKEYHKAIIHECHVCGKQYQTRGSLRSHLLVHSEERPHKCSLCQKTFKRSKQLKLHVYQHTGERPYKCQFCPKTFTNAGNRATHKRRIHSKVAAQEAQAAASNSEPLDMFCNNQQEENPPHQVPEPDPNPVPTIPQLHSVVLQRQTMLMSGMVIQHQLQPMHQNIVMHTHPLQTGVPPHGHEYSNLLP